MEQDLEKLRVIRAKFRKRDIYNLDETALFWKKSPERLLSTMSAPGLKVQKNRVTIAVCGNADGSDKVSWYSLHMSQANVYFYRSRSG
jgi:hypothetical protein